MGQGFSDLFYPDNPNRRARVDDMQHDMEALKEEFEALVAEFKKNMELIRPELDKVFKNIIDITYSIIYHYHDVVLILFIND